MIKCQFENESPALLRHVAVDAIAVRNNEIVLVRRAEHLHSEPGKWCLPGGYLNLDETAPDGARRELLEETGYESSDPIMLLVNTNPLRPGDDRQNVGFAFIVTVGAQTGSPDNEVSDLRWFPLDALPPAEEIAFDHGDNIELYKRRRVENFPLPVLL